MQSIYRILQFVVKHKIGPVFNNLQTLDAFEGFTPVCAATADQFPAAGTSCTDDSVPSPTPAPHSSCESCAAEFPPAALPFQTLRSYSQAFQTIRRSLHLRRQLAPPRRRPRPPKPPARPRRSPLLLRPAAPTARPHCAARAHFQANCSAAAPRSHRQQNSSLSTHSAPPPAAQSAPPEPENPPAARGAPAAPTEKHTRDETDPAETHSASLALPGSGA